jgi:pyrroloquinoline-quinone synthase
MDVLRRLDLARRTTNVLEHPFYERWVAGELAPAELDVYAGEYRHAVKALAEASAQAAATAPAEHRAGLERHAEEELSHVALWDQFARAARPAAGGQGRPAPTSERAAAGDAAAHDLPAEGRPASEQTKACAEAWTAGTDALEHLAVLYAIEASQPEIAKTKLDGLVEHYGYAPEGPAVEYFELHERLDVEHSRQAAELIERLLEDREDRGATCERMVARAEAALKGNWELLSGVEAAAESKGAAPLAGV